MNDFIIHSCMHPCTYPAIAGSCMPICIERFEKMHGIYTESGESMKERLTIEEVIAHCERRTERAESFFTREKLEVMPIEGSAVKEYWEHRQVREWLLELQERRKNAQRTGEWILKPQKMTCNYEWRVKVECSECHSEERIFCAGYFPGVPDDIAERTAIITIIESGFDNYCSKCGSRNEVK